MELSPETIEAIAAVTYAKIMAGHKNDVITAKDRWIEELLQENDKLKREIQELLMS